MINVIAAADGKHMQLIEPAKCGVGYRDYKCFYMF